MSAEDRVAAQTPRFVVVTVAVHGGTWDEETIAANIADDLREAGWQPLGVSVHDPNEVPDE